MNTQSFLAGLATVILMSLGICFLGDRADAVREQRQVLAQAAAPQATSSDELDPRFYHEVITLSNGVRVGNLGSMRYLLDVNGDRMSGGYHSIEIEGAGYIATLGARTYRLDSTGAAYEFK
jgi:hypothetical protein